MCSTITLEWSSMLMYTERYQNHQKLSLDGWQKLVYCFFQNVQFD